MIKLTNAIDGTTFFLNPDHVLLVRLNTEGRTFSSSIETRDGATFTVKEPPAKVVSLIKNYVSNEEIVGLVPQDATEFSDE